jgi:sodium-dependent dicarboxylate transporter 2/3/5
VPPIDGGDGEARRPAAAGGRAGAFTGARGAVPAIAAALLAAGGVWLLPAADLSASARAGLDCLVLAVVLWSLDPLPKGLASLIVVAALLATGAAHSFSAAAVGFSGVPFFFLLAVSLFGRAAERTPMVGRAADLLLALGRGRRRATLWALAAVMAGLTLVLPSAAARLQATLPVLRRLSEAFDKPQGGDGFLRTAVLIAGVLGPVATMGVMTGGNLTVVTAGLLAQQGVAVSWLLWLVAMLPPAWLTSAVGTWMAIRTQPARGSARWTPSPARPLDRSERWLLAALGSATLLWILGVSPALPAILAATVLALPAVGLVRPEDMARLDWDGLLMIGAALSLGHVLSGDGFGDWFGAHVLGGSVSVARPAGLLLFLLLALALRVVIINPAACISVLVPIILHAGAPDGGLPLALATTFVLGSFQPLPTHSPSSVVAFATGTYTVRQQVALSLKLLPVALAAALAAYVFYWPLLNLT